MAAPNARVLALKETAVFKLLHPHQRDTWLNHLVRLGDEVFEPLEDGHEFVDENDCKRRLNAWGCKEGHAFVNTRAQGNDNTPNWWFQCIFHSAKTANKYKLEDRKVVELVDGEMKVTSKRQRDTKNMRFDCPVKYVLAKVKRGGRGSDDSERYYRGRWAVRKHENHPDPSNPFIFSIHLKATNIHQQLLATALKYRIAKQPFSEAIKLLDQDGFGIELKQQEYYNLIKNQPFNKSDERSMISLLKALHDEGFSYHTRTQDSIDEDGKVVHRKLLQIVFFDKQAVPLVRRFCAGHLLIIDATFNTNNLRMPLMTSCGLTNEGNPLPVVFSYSPGEDAESYTYLIDVLQGEMFDGVPVPDVLLTDQSKAMISPYNNRGTTLINSKLLFCIWHAGQAIIARVKKGGYLKEELDIIQDLAWRYLQSETLEILTDRRQALISVLRKPEKDYIMDTWKPKEYQVITVHTRQYANLKCASTQTHEGFHNIVHQCCHVQQSLEISARSLGGRIRKIYTRLAESEDEALTKQYTGIDINAFRGLRTRASLTAIHIIEKEWLAINDNIENELCTCSIP
jgi:MULE transposase domain